MTVGADNRVATVAYARTSRMAKMPTVVYHLEVVIQLSDYGLPVKVEPPADAPVIGSR